jgi:hypothetical protein
MTPLSEMVLVLFVIHMNQTSFPMAPIMTKERSIATLLLMQESLDQQLGGRERLGMRL